MRMHIVLTMICLLLLLAGCKRKDNRESSQVSELRSQIRQLQSENEKLKEECHQLQKKYRQLKEVYNLQDEVLHDPDREESSGIYDEVFR